MSVFYTPVIIENIFALSRKYIETGALTKAEHLLRGLVTVAPDYVPAWLGLSYCAAVNEDPENALSHARKALKLDPESLNAILSVVTHLISQGEIQEAGTLLGEIHDNFQHEAPETHLKRYFELQILRFDQLRNR